MKKCLERLSGTLFFWGTAISIGFSLVYWIAGDLILFALTNNEHLIELSSNFMIWVILVPLIGAVSYIWDGIYIGATASKPMRDAMVISTFLIFLPAFYVLRPMYENHGLWAAFLLFMAVRAILMTFLAKKHVLTLNQ